MRSSPDPRPAAELHRLRAAFERLSLLPARRRGDAARREFADDPAFLGELIRLLDGADATTRFLAPPAVPDAERERVREMRALRGKLLARRWRLVRPLGSGSQGVVWEAEDEVAGGTAAVKLLRRSRSLERVRRESAALRWLRLPGVVRLLDQGEEEGTFWLAMERIDGHPFPGPSRPGPLRAAPWSEIEPVALGLLEALARIHGAGVAHGDLKPHNVLVDGRGVVTILDLGLASALTDGHRHGAVGGTPGYSAPEVAAGSPADALSDLYSAGVLLYEALTARRPEGRGLPREAAPARVRRVVSRLLARDRSRRPASAAEAVRMLRAAPGGRRTRTWTERELRARFHGHDWFHHVREDAARELHRRTAGVPPLVEEEIASWIRAGLARLEHGLVEIDRVALDRLPALPSSDGRPAPRRRRARLDAELAAALRQGDPRRTVRAAVDAGRRAMGEGRSLHALSAFELGAAAAADLPSRGPLRRALTLAASAALATATAREVERALWLVDRSGLEDDHAAAIRDLLRAAAAHQAGDARTAWRLASRAVRRAPPLVQPAAWSVRVLVAQWRGVAVHRRVVAETSRWARGHGSRAARRASVVWQAWLLYREGRCAAAARVHIDAARSAPTPAEELRCLVDAAVAARDAGHDAEAAALARRARTRAAPLRLPVREARAYFTEREVQMALGRRLRPNLAALAAVEDLGFGGLTWNSRTTEAVIAWRGGDAPLALSILAPLGSTGDPSALAPHQIPVACLRAALGEALPAGSVRLLARRAVRETAPALAVQCLALLARGAPGEARALRAHLRRLPLPRGGAELRRVREILSIRESLDALRSV